jgi:hypothetical protein
MVAGADPVRLFPTHNLAATRSDRAWHALVANAGFSTAEREARAAAPLAKRAHQDVVLVHGRAIPGTRANGGTSLHYEDAAAFVAGCGPQR